MYGLLLLGVGAATTSCEDMFTADNKLVSPDLTPQDTVYQMMGIVQRMQKLADRTVLLGEIRADLVDVNSTVATTDLQQLYNNNVDTDNAYNKPADYYDVINNCNIYLAYVDDSLKTQGRYYYEKEIAAAKGFRAWCYLELLKIYGEVPFVTEPVLTADDAENIVSSGRKENMATILDFCIADLETELLKNPTKNLEMRPTYGVTFWQEISCDNFFIPLRPLIAELCLWRGSYEGQSDAARPYYLKAISMYHDYFCFPNEERGVRTYASGWGTRDYNTNGWLTTLPTRFDVGSSENVAILPCDTVAYYGNVANIRTVFNSQYSNNYYPWTQPSARLYSISASQDFCYLDYDRTTGKADVIYFPHDPSEYTKSIYVGDMRLSTVYQTASNQDKLQENANFNAIRSWIIKWANGSMSFPRTDVKQSYIPFYRTSVLYLHMAEALNRAGFPETAFAVLKYGLTKQVMDNRNIISQAEFDALAELKTLGFSLTELNYSDDQNSSFVVWPSSVFYNPDNVNPNNNTTGTIAQIGIHSIGSGCTELNERYYLPTDSSEVVDVPAILPVPAVLENPGELMEYEPWCEMEGRDPDRSTSKTYYDRYVKQYETDLAAYEAWLVTYPADSLAYEESVKAHNEAVEHNAAWLASDGVRSGRMAEVAKMLLDEEALEGMFEGHRFYDLMRYQMQMGKLQGVNATITMPEPVVEKYGNTQRENMVGRPWYLKLPNR